MLLGPSVAGQVLLLQSQAHSQRAAGERGWCAASPPCTDTWPIDEMEVKQTRMKTIAVHVVFFRQFIEKRREMKQEGRTDQEVAESFCFLFPDKSKVSRSVLSN